MSQYLTPLASSLPGTAPGPLVHLGGSTMDSGLFHQRGVLCMPLPFMVWGVPHVSLVPVGSALRAPVPQDTTSMGPCRPDPEEDISGLHLCHGVQCVTSHPPFIDGQCFGDTTFTWRCRPDPEEHISAESHLRHGIRLATSHALFFNGG